MATVRPETMFADTAIAVHPSDERYSRLVGETAVLPLVGRRLPIIADEHVDPAFGTGALKVTPGHDPSDFEIGRAHRLDEITVIGEDGRMTEAARPRPSRHGDRGRTNGGGRRPARAGLVSGTRPYLHDVPTASPARGIEPLISLAVVLRHEHADRAGHRGGARGPSALHPETPWTDVYLNCSRASARRCVAAALVGPPAAGLVSRGRGPRGRERARRRGLGARPRRARHLVLVRVCGRSRRSAGPRRRPSCALSDRRAVDGVRDIIFLWVACAWRCSGSS